MNKKIKMLAIVILSAIALVGCDNAETKELKSLHKLGYEQAIKEYKMTKPSEAMNGPRQPPIEKLKEEISPEGLYSWQKNSLSTSEEYENDELYKKYNELMNDELNNNEKIEALLYGYRNGFYDAVKNSTKFISSKKGEESIDKYLNGIDEINGEKITSSVKLNVKNAIINYSNIVLEQLNIYEDENGKYVGSMVPINQNLIDVNNEFFNILMESGYPTRLLARYAYMDIWYEQQEN